MDVNANNVANVNSDKFKSVDTKLEEAAKESPRAVLREGIENPTGKSGTDLTKELTDQIPIEKGFGVNTTVVKTKDEMLGTLMDMKS
jgi:flagellar hook protein FlgE